MKIGKWALLFLAATPLLSGCKGFWDVPSSSSGGSGGGGGTASGVFYVINQSTPEIAGFSFAANATTLTAVASSPFQLGAATPHSIAVSHNGGFLYVGTVGGIFAYSINQTTGTLSILNSGQAISSDQAFTLAVDPSGSWLVDAVTGLAAVNAIPLDSTTGGLLTGGVEESISLPSSAISVQQVAISPSGSTNPYVFVAMATSGIAVIPFNSSASGNPFGSGKVYSPINSTGGDATIAVDVNTSRPELYVGETVAFSGSTNPGGLRMFNIGANATLTEVSGSPYKTGGIGPSSILSTSSYLYVANRSVTSSNNGNITGFAITQTGTSFSLTAISNGTVSTGVATVGLAEDSTGTYVLAVNLSGSPDLNAFTIGTGGVLKSYATASTGSDPTGTVAIAAQ